MTELERVLSGESRWCLLEGDWRDALKALPDKSVDHVITDPPYSPRTHAGARSDKTGEVSDLGIDFACMTQDERESLADTIERVTARWCLLFCDAESAHLWRGSFVEFQQIRTGIWVRRGSTPQFTGDRPAVGHEEIVIAHPKGRKHWNGGGRAAVWTATVERNDREHPTQKPLDLMLQLVQDFTDPGDVILDPYAGSGTTGVAALRLGRRAILCERKAEYAATCRERMAAEERQQSLRSLRSGQLPLLGQGHTVAAQPSLFGGDA